MSAESTSSNDFPPRPWAFNMTNLETAMPAEIDSSSTAAVDCAVPVPEDGGESGGENVVMEGMRRDREHEWKANERCRTLSTVDSSELSWAEKRDDKIGVCKLDPLPSDVDDESVTGDQLEGDAVGEVVASRCLRKFVVGLFTGAPTPHRPQSRPVRLLRLFVVYSILLFVVMVLILWCGKTYEKAQVRKGPDTLQFYETPSVCAMQMYTEINGSELSTNERIETKTLDSVDQPFVANHTGRVTRNVTREIVAHCGGCGACSNPHDIRLYDETKNTLYLDSVHCAKRGILGGRGAVEQCLKSSVDMTTVCTSCWVDNIMCDLRKCIFTCFFHAVFNKGVHSKGDSEVLNDCTKCDEVRCGTQFITCAGANRRRTGILSDIERDENTEVCHKVDPKNWWNDESIQLAWERQQEVGDARSP